GARRRAAVGGGERERHRKHRRRRERCEDIDALVVAVALAQPLRERASHLLALAAQLARLARRREPCVPRRDRIAVAASPGGERARRDRQVAPADAERELVDEPGARARLVTDESGVDRRLDAFRIAE